MHYFFTPLLQSGELFALVSIFSLIHFFFEICFFWVFFCFFLGFPKIVFGFYLPVPHLVDNYAKILDERGRNHMCGRTLRSLLVGLAMEESFYTDQAVIAQICLFVEIRHSEWISQFLAKISQKTLLLMQDYLFAKNIKGNYRGLI